MNWFKLTLICTVVFLAGFLADQPGMGDFWFLSKSTLSAVVVISALCLPTRVAMPIAILEMAFIGVTLIAALQHDGNIYQHYEQILIGAVVVEFMLLAWGAPWGGIRRLAESLGTFASDRLPAGWLRAVGGFKNARSVQAQVQAK